MYKKFKFYIFVHDKFFIVNMNPYGPTTSFWQFEGNSMQSHYQEIALIKHKRLNLDHQPCEEAEDYSFNICVKESLSEKVGCRLPWDRWSRQDRAICTEREQFKQFDIQYTDLMLAEVANIERSTGCLKPCSYNEYKFANSNPKETVVPYVPEDQLAIILWAVTQYTQFEEEVPSVNHHHSSWFSIISGALVPFHLLVGRVWGLPRTFPRLLLCHNLGWDSEPCKVAEEQCQPFLIQISVFKIWTTFCFNIHSIGIPVMQYLLISTSVIMYN